MHSKPALVAALLLLVAGPSHSTSFQLWESSLGAPGVTALFGPGPSTADIDFDADSAEGGGLLFGASEIEIVPFGDVSLLAFSCQLSGCAEGSHYLFTPGDAGAGGKLIVSDSDPNEKHGVFDLGMLDLTGLSGGLQLSGCNYTGADASEYSCDSFTLVQLVPEPGTGVLAGASLAAFAIARRWRRSRLRSFRE